MGAGQGVSRGRARGTRGRRRARSRSARPCSRRRRSRAGSTPRSSRFCAPAARATSRATPSAAGLPRSAPLRCSRRRCCSPGPGPAPILAVAGPAAAASVLGRRRARYRRGVERGVPEIAAAVADALSGGRSVRGALAAAAASLDGPPAVEMARLRADLELGASTGEALAALRRRMRSPRVDALSAALLSQQLGGGDLAALLRRHAAAAADRDRVAADARAATAQARFTGLLVVAMPSGAALFAELVEPGFLARILADPAATILLALAAGLQLGGFAAIRRLSRIGDR